jgi:hypothetical protein
MATMFSQDAPVENKAVEFADKLIELILKYEIGPSTFDKAKVIIENKHVFAIVDKQKIKKYKVKAGEQESDARCAVPKRDPSVTLSLDDGCQS